MFFFAAWSMEQVGSAAIVIGVTLTIINYIENRKVNKSSTIICISTLVGYTMLIRASGNYKRLDTHDLTISLINKIVIAMKNISCNWCKYFIKRDRR